MINSISSAEMLLASHPLISSSIERSLLLGGLDLFLGAVVLLKTGYFDDYIRDRPISAQSSEALKGYNVDVLWKNGSPKSSVISQT